MKRVVSLVSAAALALSVTATPSSANDDAAKAIAGIIALGVLGAAVADHQHKRGHNEDTPHPQLHPDENAAGLCAHHGEKLVAKAGGYELEVEHVNSVEVGSDGATHVSMVMTGYYPAGHKTSDVICVIKNHKVTSFNNN